MLVQNGQNRNTNFPKIFCVMDSQHVDVQDSAKRLMSIRSKSPEISFWMLTKFSVKKIAVSEIMIYFKNYASELLKTFSFMKEQ